jgi:guanine deaminase
MNIPSKSELSPIERCIELAIESAKRGGFPNGSLIVKNGYIISESISMAEQVYDPTSHAEVTCYTSSV